MFSCIERYCPECDCPDLCDGVFCLRDEAGDDRETAITELKEPEPTVLINQPEFNKQKDFLKEIIS